MEGRCPECNRAYDISEEFLAMGGKAKCPHCLLELEFAPITRGPARDEARFRESTKPDPRRRHEGERAEAVELDSHCASCGRHFKVDSEYLETAGSAQCPHCGLDLVFEGGLPEPQTAIDQSDADFPTQEDAGNFDVEIDDNDGEEFGIGSDDEQEQELPESGAASYGGEAGDPWAATTELNLPELDSLRAEASGEAAAVSHEESGFEDEQELPEGDDEENFLQFDDQVDFDGVAADFDAHMDSGEEIAGDGGEEFSAPEDEWNAPDENVIVGKLESEGPVESVEPGIVPEDEEEFSAEEEAGEESRGEQEEQAAEEEEQQQQELAAVDEAPGESHEGPEAELGDAGEEAKQEELPVEVPEDSWPVDAEDEFPQGSEQAKSEEPGAGSPDKEQTEDQERGEDKGVFSGLASTEDWATAAARWAESGFKADAIPSFIQDTDRVSEKEDSGAASQEEEESSGQLLLAQQAEQAVEVSDADIMMLDEGEVAAVDQDQTAKPSPGDQENWAQRASRQLAIKASPAGAPAPQSRFRRVKSPPVVAGAIGLLVLIAGGLVWILMSGEKNIDKVAFPTKGLKAVVVSAPGPSAYKAKPAAVEHYGLGNRLAYHGKMEDAIIEYKQAARLDHGYPHPYRALGAIYAALGKHRLSVDAYQSYLRLSPHAPDRRQVRKIIKDDHAE
ncbi:MAG TPA: hypothetical protein VM425_08460 [Myxococcota bacterium]|nr:hypothetical protein [Myxococcota bacterium]